MKKKDLNKIRAYSALIILSILLIVLWANGTGLINDFTRDGTVGLCLMTSLAVLIFCELAADPRS